MSTDRLTLRRRVSKIKTGVLPAAKPSGGDRPDDGRGRPSEATNSTILGRLGSPVEDPRSHRHHPEGKLACAVRDRLQTTKPGRIVPIAIGAIALGFVLTSAAMAYEEPDSPKPGNGKTSPAFSAAEMRLREDITYLAADAREGRAPGTNGIEAAADYIAKTFQAAGSSPRRVADGYFQNFTIGGHPSLGKTQELAVYGPDGKAIRAEGQGEFSPMAIGVSATLEKIPLVFAGYGITAKDDARKLNYDDYADVDVKGKAVLILRHKPREEDAASPFGGRQGDPLLGLPAQGHQRLPARRVGRPPRQRPDRDRRG